MHADRALDDTDAALLRRFVDEQISPFRKLGVALVAIAPLGFLVAFLEWRDLGLSEPASTTTLIAAGIGAALALIGIVVWFQHRSPEPTRLYRVLVTERSQVTRVVVDRVVNSQYDRIVVYSQLSAQPLRLLVLHRDRDAVASLLARAYPNAR